MNHLENQRFGHLTAIERLPGRKWRCICDCGKEKVVFASNLIQGTTISCGCHKNESKPDLTGQRFGLLVVIERDCGKIWRCRCDCGSEKSVVESHLLRGIISSCGCLRKKLTSYIGQRFGRLLVIDCTPDNKLLCVCDCGNETIVASFHLKSGTTCSCGCLKKELLSVDISGQRFGKLLAIKPTGKYENHNAFWNFKCDCGRDFETTVNAVKWEHRYACDYCMNEVKKKLVQHASEYCEFIDGTSVPIIKSKTLNKNNTSGYKGVTWHKHCNKWNAYIRFKGISYVLGYFREKEDAVKARAEAEERLHGPFLEWYEEYKRQNSINNEDIQGEKLNEKP